MRQCLIGLILFAVACYTATTLHAQTSCPDNVIVIEKIDAFGDGWNGATYSITEQDSTVVLAMGTLSSGSYGTDTLCLPNGCYDFTIAVGAFANEVSWNVINVTGIQDTLASGGGITETVSFAVNTFCTILGCTDPAAINFDPAATVNDGTCVYGPIPDVCDDATVVSCGGSYYGSTSTATYDGVGSCGTSNTAPGVWYKIVGNGDNVTASTCGYSTFDTKISVFQGPCASLNCVDGNDDACPYARSEITFSTNANTSYFILVHGFQTAVGDFELTITCEPPPAPPVNNFCSGALPIYCGTSVSGSTEHASISPQGFLCNGINSTAPGIWYSFGGTGGAVTFTMCNTANFDTQLQLYSGSCGSLSCVTANNDGSGCGSTSQLTNVTTSVNTDYFLHVTATGSDTGHFTLSVNCDASGYETTLDTMKLCFNDSTLVHGVYRSQVGHYVDTVGAIDTLHVVVLEPAPTYNDTVAVSLCQNDSIYLEGSFTNIAGVYTDTLSSVFGCDSVVTTFLDIIPTVIDSISSTICSNDSIFLSGTFQNTPGLYSDTFTTTLGCDSIIVTDLTVLPSPVLNLSATICDGDSILLWGTFETTPGDYAHAFQGANGCDSTVIYTLTVLPIATSLDTLTICEGDSAFLGGGFQYTSGIYSNILTGSNGCDSLAQFQLIFQPAIPPADTLALCSGDSIFVAGAYQSIPGTYTDSMISIIGCDSIVTTTLIAAPIYSGVDTLVICEGDSVLLAGTFQTIAGTYVDSLQSVIGCDSVVTTTLVVHSVSLTEFDVALCAGDSIAIYGTTQNTAGTYYDTLTTTTGCDSVLATTILVHPVWNDTLSYPLCSGDSVFAAGSWQFTQGLYTDFLQTASGCDSTVSLDLVVYSVFDTAYVDSICLGEAYTLPDGSVATSDTVHTSVLASSDGCDSLVTVSLAVLPLPQQPIIIGPAFVPNAFASELYSVTDQQGYTYNWTVTNGNVISGQGSNAATVQWGAMGTGSVNLAWVDLEGCSNDTTLEVQIGGVPPGIENYGSNDQLRLYPNPTRGILVVERMNGWEPGTQFLIIDGFGSEVVTATAHAERKHTLYLNNLASGVYTLKIVSASGVRIFPVVKN